MEARAEARYIRISAQKARLVVDMIRGQKAGSAILTLQTVNKRIAPTVEKVLKSAIANARNTSTDVWVDFKVFVVTPLTLVFGAMQVPLLKKYAVEGAE